jgi:hypothetical protein
MHQNIQPDLSFQIKRFSRINLDDKGLILKSVCEGGNTDAKCPFFKYCKGPKTGQAKVTIPLNIFSQITTQLPKGSMLNNIKRIANCSRISEIPDYYTSVDFEP